MSDGFPLLTTKKMAWKTMVTELLWFLRGDTNIKFLVENGCHIWDGDAFKNYIKNNPNSDEQMVNDDNKMVNIKDWFINKIKTDKEFAKKWGELGPVYGKQWRGWSNYRRVDSVDEVWSDYRKEDPIDQIANLINDLKTNPDSRRLMVNAWNVGELDSMVLPPCHYGFQVYTRELSDEERYGLIEKDKHIQFVNWQDLGTDRIREVLDEKNVPKRAISLMWNQRSVDTFLGLPFNIASYGLLLEIIAKEVNMVPDELIGNLGDTHLYLNHIEQAKEQIGRELSESERYKIFEDRGYEFRMVKDWSKEEQYDKAGIPKRTREPYPLPKLLCLDEFHYLMDEELVGEVPFPEKIEKFRPDFFTLGNYQAHPHIKAPLSN
jgi:thymidylate synthase